MKKIHTKRENELASRINEQNNLIRILRNSLSSPSSPATSSISFQEAFSLNPSSLQTTTFTQPTTASVQTTSTQPSEREDQLFFEVQQLHQKMEDKENELAETRKRVDKLEEQRSILLQKLETTSVVPSITPTTPVIKEPKSETRDEEIERLEVKVQNQKEKIATLEKQLEELSRTSSAEIDQSHENELKLLEQVEAYEYSIQQLRTRVSELEDFIVSADLSPHVL
jgi:hypothetical protein